MVPRARIAEWPTWGIAIAMSGACSRTSGERSRASCRASAPMTSPSAVTRMASRSGMRLMSMTARGAARRRLSAGTRLWPPARRRPSSP